MPALIVSYIVSTVVSYVVESYIAATLISQAIGAIAGFATSAVVNAAYSDQPDSQTGGGFEQELAGNLVTIRQPITHWQWIYGRTRVGGALTFAHATSDNVWLYMVITLAGHPCEEIEKIYFNDEEIDLGTDGAALGKYAGYVGVIKDLGSTGQPFPGLIAASEGRWTEAHRQAGRTKILVALAKNPDLFPTGIPNITAVIKGKRVYDPRSLTEVWTYNASLCQADLLCSPVWLNATYEDEIDEDQLIAAANIDDEVVALANGGTENRYMLNGAFDVNMDTRSALARMLTANAGRVNYIGGLWRILPAAYVAPTLTFDEGDLRGVPHITPRLSAAELANGVKGVYVEPGQLWQPTDFPPVTNATYLEEDQGERSWRELDLPFTTSAATAQRIAKIELERMRQQISVDWPGKFTCFRAQAGDAVALDFTMMGWSGKVYDVVGSGLAIEDDGAGGVRLGSDLGLRETDSSVFDWNSGEETQVDPAPDTQFPDPFTTLAPGAPAVVETLYETTGSAGVKAKATVSWGIDGPQDIDFYELEYKAAGDTTYMRISPISVLFVDLFDLAPGTYTFRARAVSPLGVHSAYSPVTTAEIKGLIAPPSDVAGFSVVASNGFAYASWTLHEDLDVRIGGRIEIAHAPVTTGGVWNLGILLKQFDGNAVVGVLPLVTGTYMAKAIDSTGHYSENAVSFVLTEGMITGFTTVGTQTEAPGFTGTKLNCAVAAAKLSLSSGELFDAHTGNFDSQAGLFDAYGGQATTGSYTFGPLDLSTVAVRRFEADIAVGAVDNGDFFDEQQGDFDDQDGLFEGNVVAINDANAVLYARLTNDTPIGSPTPTWGPWIPFHVADFNCRAAEFRLDLSVDTPAHNIQISTLTVHAKEFA